MENITASIPSPASLAAEIESAEIAAWRDMYQAIPQEYMEQFRPEFLDADGIAFTRCAAIPFIHFNNVLNLGIGSPATEARIDMIRGRYAEAGIARFTVLLNPGSQPAELGGWLEARGFAVKGAWERIYRPAAELAAELAAPKPTVTGAVELVTGATAEEWASYLVNVYGLPTGPWLLNFALRPGWTHAILRREGAIAAVRGMFTSGNGRAWLGVEAPVPGLMGPTYDDDYALDYALVAKGIENGVVSFSADIEAPSAKRDTPAYANWSALGFEPVYMREHYSL